MSDQLTKANINLYSVIRNLEDLLVLDENTQEIIKGRDLSIQFSIKNGPQGQLHFKDGKCTFKRGKHKSNIKLYFKSPKHFNSMIDGDASPIPLKGLTKIKFLTEEFTQLVEKLTYYLKPNDELLRGDEYLNINTQLTAYTAFFALSEIANNDKLGKLNASRIPNGTIEVRINNGGPIVHILCKDGELQTRKGKAEMPRAVMSFEDIPTANLVLNGKADFYTCLATEKVKMQGYIPMLDNLSKLLAQIPQYL